MFYSLRLGFFHRVYLWLLALSRSRWWNSRGSWNVIVVGCCWCLLWWYSSLPLLLMLYYILKHKTQHSTAECVHCTEPVFRQTNNSSAFACVLELFVFIYLFVCTVHCARMCACGWYFIHFINDLCTHLYLSLFSLCVCIGVFVQAKYICKHCNALLWF